MTVYLGSVVAPGFAAVDMGQHNETRNGDWVTWCRVVSWFCSEHEGEEAEAVLAVLFANP